MNIIIVKLLHKTVWFDIYISYATLCLRSFLKLPLTYTMASLWELFSHLLFNLNHVSAQYLKQAEYISCPLLASSAALYHIHLLKSRESVLGDDVARLMFFQVYTRESVSYLSWSYVKMGWWRLASCNDNVVRRTSSFNLFFPLLLKEHVRFRPFSFYPLSDSILGNEKAF